MSKRFTDSDKWRDEWWGSLSNDYRMIWLYLIDHCSIAGIWKKDLRGLNFNCNTSVTESDLVELMAGRLVDCGKFFFIPSYIKFQYSNGLASNKPMILSVVKELTENNLLGIIKERLGNDYPIIKVMVKEKEREREIVKEKEKGVQGEKQKTKLTPPESWPLDDFSPLWADFLEMRRKKKQPMTANAEARRMTRLVEVSGGVWAEAKRILIKATDNAWLDFYPIQPNGREPERIEAGKTLIYDKA